MRELLVKNFEWLLAPDPEFPTKGDPNSRTERALKVWAAMLATERHRKRCQTVDGLLSIAPKAVADLYDQLSAAAKLARLPFPARVRRRLRFGLWWGVLGCGVGGGWLLLLPTANALSRWVLQLV